MLNFEVITVTEHETATKPIFKTSERQSSDWDIRNAPRNYASLLLTQIISAFFSFASVWLITKTLGSEGYGGIVAMIAASQVIQITVNWSSTALIRFGVEEFVTTGKISRSFWTRSIILLPNLLLALLSAYFWLAPLAGWLKIPQSSMWLIAFHLFSAALWLHFQYALQAAKMMPLQGAMLALERVVTFTILLGFLGLDKLSAENALLSYIIPSFLMSAISCFFLKAFVECIDFFHRRHFRQMLVFSLPLIPFALIGYLSTSQLDALFINQLLSKNDLGVYSVATQISGLTLQLPIIANGILLSMFVSLRTSGKDSTIATIFRNLVPSLTLVWGVFCACLAFAGVILIPLVFGETFAASAKPLWILLAASTLTFPVLIGLATLTNTYSKTYISMVASIFTAGVNLLFNILLIPRFGLIGCAWATAAAGAATLTVFYFLLRRENLLEKNWVFAAVLPAIAGGAAVSVGLEPISAVAVCALTTSFVGIFQIKPIQEAILILRKRLNAENVS